MIGLSDGLGTTLETQYRYEPYGKTRVLGQASRKTQQYTGRENDATGLYYYRARYYDPETGRFVSPDPIGWAAGQTNGYAYVGGDPISRTDPTGQFAMLLPLLPPTAEAIGAGIGAYLGWNVLGPIIAENNGGKDCPSDKTKGPPKTGEPNSEYWPGKRPNGQYGNGRRYGSDGLPDTDYHNDGKNHGNDWPDHPGGEHVHDWGRDANGNPIMGGLAHIHLGLSKDIYVASAFIKA